MIAYFLNDNFHVQSILKFKAGIIKIQAISPDEPDILDYIDEDNAMDSLCIGRYYH